MFKHKDVTNSVALPFGRFDVQRRVTSPLQVASGAARNPCMSPPRRLSLPRRFIPYKEGYDKEVAIKTGI